MMERLRGERDGELNLPNYVISLFTYLIRIRKVGLSGAKIDGEKRSLKSIKKTLPVAVRDF